MAVALVFAMKLRDSRIYLNDDLEAFMTNLQPAVTEENYSEILRCSNDISECQTMNDHENPLHLACQEQNGLKKLKQFVTGGVICNPIPSYRFF